MYVWCESVKKKNIRSQLNKDENIWFLFVRSTEASGQTAGMHGTSNGVMQPLQIKKRNAKHNITAFWIHHRPHSSVKHHLEGAVVEK